ncbi:MAG: HIT family protein [Chitinophagales bacterium]|nr:HIT family protein [Chitinophagales bacterium]
MPSIFTRIINREIPAYIVAEDDKFIAFLDVFPLAVGHVLVVPKNETDYLFDLDDDQLSGIMLFAKMVAGALRKSVTCKRVGVAVIGLEVPHAHIHLVPLQQIDDINFSRPKLKSEEAKLAETAAAIRSNMPQ